MNYHLYDAAYERLPEELKLVCKLIEINDKHTIYEEVTLASQLPGFQWDLFLNFARHHRVYPILYEHISGIKALPIPIHITNALRSMYQSNTFRMMQMLAELRHINNTFEEQGIRTMVLKGPALSQKLFGNYVVRTSKDLDIYISVEDIEQAEHLLHQEGYTATYENFRIGKSWRWREHHLSYTHKIKNIQVELHWRLGPDTDQEPTFEELWERKKVCNLSGTSYNTLGNEDLFMFLTGHGSRHGWFRLRWLLDIQKLLEQEMDWDLLKYLLKKYHGEAFASQALTLTSILFKKEAPAQSELLDYRAPKSSPFVLDVLNFVSSTETKSTLDFRYKVKLFNLKTFKQKVVYIVSRAFPNSWDAAVLPLPRKLHFLYFLLRPFILLWRQAKRLTTLIRV